MKKFFVLLFMLLTVTVINCNAQPRSDYEIVATSVSGASKYHFFLEKNIGSTPSALTDSMDYLNPDVTYLKIGESSTPIFTVANLLNDGSEYTVGVVAENAAGYYGGMRTGTGTVGIVPNISAGVTFRKKQ